MTNVECRMKTETPVIEVRSSVEGSMSSLVGALVMAFLFHSTALALTPDSLVLVRGSDGTPEYAKVFDEEVADWQTAATRGLMKADFVRTGEALKAKLVSEASKKEGVLWLVLIGHGTFDGREARFNVEGRDFTAEELAGWLKPVEREVVIIDNASASGAFVKPLSAAKRVIVAATKAGDEVFYPRFGEHFAKAIGGLPEADLDQDKEVSVLEAFLYAARQATQFYETEQRISTEHAIIDDNGDGTGTRSEVFEGTRAKDPKQDGARAHQLALVHNETERKLAPEVRAQRDALETKVRELVNKKSSLSEDEYYQQLEELFRQIARLTTAVPAK